MAHIQQVSQVTGEQQIENTYTSAATARDVHPELLLAMNTRLAKSQGQSATSENRNPSSDDLPKVSFTHTEAGYGTRASHNAPIPEEVQRYAREHGLKVKLADGNYEYHLIANGRDKLIASVDSRTPLKDGFRQVDDQINPLVHQKMAELKARFGADFSTNNEYASFKDDRGHHKIPCREPDLKELAAAEAALSKNVRGSGAAPKLYFLKHNIDGYYGADALTGKDESGRKAIFIQSSFAYERATNADGTYRGRSMEYVLAHELNHAARLDDPGHSRDNSPLAPATPEEIARYDRTGWSVIADKSGNKCWALRGKNGEYYTLVDTFADAEWVRVNKNGELLRGDGKPFPPDDLRDPEKYRALLEADSFLRFDQVRQRAKVTPPTSCFTGPEEELCDAEALFHDRDKRAWLLRLSPQVYDVAKELDQERIDRSYGKGADGKPIKVRNSDGEIVDATNENLESIRQFEEDGKKIPPRKY